MEQLEEKNDSDINANLREIVAFKNSFVRTKRTHCLSLKTKKVQAMLISRLDRRESTFSPIRMAKDDLYRCGINSDRSREEFTNLFEELNGIKVDIPIEKDGRKDFVLTSLLNSIIIHDDGTGDVSFCFDNALRPFLLQLNGFYSRYDLSLALGLSSSSYSLDLYEILTTYVHRQHKDEVGNGFPKATPTLSVEELKGWLGCNKYKNFRDFEDYVIKPAIKELKARSDLFIDYKRIKTGRKFTHLGFILQRQEYQLSLIGGDDANGGAIDPSIEELLMKFAYRAKGEARKFIVEMSSKHGVEVIVRALTLLNNDYRDQPKRVRGGVVKNQLEDYVKLAQRSIHHDRLKKESNLEEDLKARAYEAYNKRIAAAVADYRLLNDCSEFIKEMPSHYGQKKDLTELWLNTKIGVFLEKKDETLTFDWIMENLKKKHTNE